MHTPSNSSARNANTRLWKSIYTLSTSDGPRPTEQEEAAGLDAGLGAAYAGGERNTHTERERERETASGGREELS